MDCSIEVKLMIDQNTQLYIDLPGQTFANLISYLKAYYRLPEFYLNFGVL